MKPERNVMRRKPTEKELSTPVGETSSVLFSSKLHGTGRKITPFEHLISPMGKDERMHVDVPGNQSEPRQSDHGQDERSD